MKKLIFLLCLCFSTNVMSKELIQAALLSNHPGASRDLNGKLRCLQNKLYPADIEECMLSGFPSVAEQRKVEKCLRSGNGRLVDLDTDEKINVHRLLMIVACKNINVAVELKKQGRNYVVTSIARLVE